MGCFSHVFLLSISHDSGELGIFKSDRNRYSLASPISGFALISACCVFENYFPALSAMPQMLTDSRAGKIDLIITKSVSRLARNTVDCITMVRNLAELRNPVGVFFESECIFSLNEDTSMPLSFLASIAENESRIRSRSMEVSLAQRLNGGLPLTPKLLGYSHDADGKLVINPDEAPTVKLIFYMYLSGYSSSHIAKTLEALGKTTFLGNTKWTSGTVIQVLRNERHCGDVLTRKTWTPDVISHKSKKNRGERQQSLYKGEHEAIVSRDDYIAVQHMINNAKYGGKSILPELRVIESGVLKGFVTISPKWAGFKAADYLQASMSVYTDDTYYGQPAEGDATFEVAAGDFDLRGFEVTNSSLFDANKRPYVLFQSKQIKFSTDCVRQFGKDNKVELLIHPGLRKLAVRRASKDSRQCVQWSRPDDGKYYAKEIPCTAFGGTLFELLDWETDFKFRAYADTDEEPVESMQETLPLIKIPPMHDPDAEIAGLTLTVPSWVSSIERARNNADMNAASTSAKSKLEEALLSLQEKVSEMLSEIREVD